MDNVGLIEAGLRKARCSKDLAIALLSVTMIAYYNEVEAMAKKRTGSQTGRQPQTTEETPAQAFHRLAQGRTNKACKSITLIAQLTGSAYESTDVQRRAIVEALKAAVEVVANVFEGKGKASDKFQLPA